MIGGDSTAMMLRISDMVRMVTETALPSDCPLCREPLGDHSGGVCGRCWREALGREEAAAVDSPAGRYLSGATVLGAYRGRLRAIVRRLKYADMTALAAPLGRSLARRLGEGAGPYDAVVPVPLHWTRRWRRSYNQADLIAREVAIALDRPMAKRALKRTRPTRSQTGGSREARVANVRGAFRAGGLLTGASVLLVDDVMTTGATITECARTLIAAGAGRVHAAAAARTLPRN